MNPARLLVVATTLAVACSTPQPSPAARPEPQATPAALEAQRKPLVQLADALAAVGMSVPLPPRVCDAGRDGVTAPPCGQYAWNDDVGCVVEAWGENGCLCMDCDTKEARQRAYAHAIVAARAPGPDADKRGDELVDAYLAHDNARLTVLARALETAFDARRAHAPVKAHKDKPAEHIDAKSVAGVVVDAGPVPDGGVDAKRAHDEVKDGAADAGTAALTLHDKLVGTWTYDEGAIRNVYALCDDGAYLVKFEIVDESLGALDDLPTVRGTWKAADDKITFTALGDSVEAPISSVSDDTLDFTMDSEHVHLERRSKSASCD